MSFPNTLTIFINTRLRGYPKIKYEPDMTIPKTKSQTVYFNPLIKLNNETVNTIPPGYPATEKFVQFFNKNEYESLLGRNIADTSQKKITLEEATHMGIIDNNIKVTLNTLFNKNNLFYIHGKPNTILSYEWINGDWMVDKKSFEKKIVQNVYGRGLLYNQQQKMDEIEADKELEEFKKNHSSVIKGFAASTDISKFKDDLIIDEIKDKASTTYSQEIINKSIKQWGNDTLPKKMKSLLTKTLISENFFNINNELNLSSSPITLTLLYANDTNYSKDIKLNKGILESLYIKQKNAGIKMKKAMEKYETMLGSYSENILQNTNIPIITDNVYKNKKIFDETVKNFKRIIDQIKGKGITIREIMHNEKYKSTFLNASTTIETYKNQFLSLLLESYKALLQKNITQKEYIITLIKFYTNLYNIKKKSFEFNRTVNEYQNVFYLQILKLDIDSYTDILINMNSGQIFNENNEIKDIINNIENYIKTNSGLTQNYRELIEKFFNYPELLNIDRYRLDIYMFNLLKHNQNSELYMWEILYNQTYIYLNNIKQDIIGDDANPRQIIEGKLHKANIIVNQYNEKYPENQRNILLQNIRTINKPLKKQTVLLFKSDEQKQYNDYLKMQQYLVYCYDCITMYIRISIITYSREISYLTAQQNIGNLNIKEFDREIECLTYIGRTPIMLDYISNYLYWNPIQFKNNNALLLQSNAEFEANKITSTLELSSIYNRMDGLNIKYTDTVDILIPQISKIGFQNKCKSIIDDYDNPITSYEKKVERMMDELYKNYDVPKSIALRDVFALLIAEGLANNVLNDQLNINQNALWNIYDNLGAGDCLFYAVSELFNYQLLIDARSTNNPFSDNGLYTVSSLRRAVADVNHGITDAQIDALNMYRNEDPNDEEYRYLFDNGKWIGNNHEAVRNAMRQPNKYWGDQQAIQILEKIFKIKFIIIDTTTLSPETPFPIGIDVVFNTNGVQQYGTVVQQQPIVAGQQFYTILEYVTNRIYNNLGRNDNVIGVLHLNYFRTVVENGNLDIADQITQYAFLIYTDGPHYEIMYNQTINKCIYIFQEIPDYLKYLIFKTQWKYLTDEGRQNSWYYANNTFRGYMEHVEGINSIRPYWIPPPLSPPPPPPFGLHAPSAPMFGGSINSQNKYININSRSNTNMSNNMQQDNSKLSYYIIIDLELYPGKSVPPGKQAVIACHLKYEKIRQSYADMFGLLYQPTEYVNQDVQNNEHEEKSKYSRNNRNNRNNRNGYSRNERNNYGYERNNYGYERNNYGYEKGENEKNREKYHTYKNRVGGQKTRKYRFT
jgi:hypothetical protein